MKNKYLRILLIFVAVLTLTACFDSEEKDNKKALEFKNDYEEINGKENNSGKIHRSITLSENNLFEETTPEDIVKKIENKETFYVYFGSRLCPWCRSVLEMADKVSRENEIEKIYYIDIWDDEGNEILRDKYTINDDNELEVSFEGTESYKKLLEYFDDLLSDYTLVDNDGKAVETNEKRIYAPNFVYVKDGKAIRLTERISQKQNDSREELTEEMLKDEEELFNKFFVSACDDKC